MKRASSPYPKYFQRVLTNLELFMSSKETRKQMIRRRQNLTAAMPSTTAEHPISHAQHPKLNQEGEPGLKNKSYSEGKSNLTVKA